MNDRREPTRPAQPAEVDTDIVMFLLGPDGELLDGDPPDRSGWTMADVVRAFNESRQTELAQDPLGRNRRGPRSVQGTGRPAKAGYRDEIMVTLRSSPADAIAEAVRGDFFDPSIPRLQVDRTSLNSSRYEMSWAAKLRGWGWQAREVRIRLYPSPSLNVTALAMTPYRPRRVARNSFLRSGKRVMSELRDRLDDEVVRHSGES